MKDVINGVIINRGMSLSQLSRDTKIPFWSLWNAKNNRNYLDTNQMNRLRRLNDLPSLQTEPRRNKIIRSTRGYSLDVKCVFPRRSRTKKQMYAKRISNNMIRFWYQPGTRRMAELCLPRAIRLDAFFMTTLGLSIGDGLNNPGIRNNHYGFANINFELSERIYHWLTDYFKIPKEKIQIHLKLPRGYRLKNKKKLVAGLLDINEDCIKNYRNERSRSPALHIQVSNIIFQCLYLELFKQLQNRILRNREFRRNFLKGLFAAEGHVKHSTYGTLESISFAFNPHTEIKLAYFVKKCLIKEGIKSKIEKRGYLYFCDYNQMLKFYSLGLIGLHREKEEKFIRLLKNAKVYFGFKKGFVKQFVKMPQSKIAACWGISQAGVSHHVTNDRLSRVLANKLIKKSILNENVEYLMVGSNTIRDKQLMKIVTTCLL